MTEKKVVVLVMDNDPQVVKVLPLMIDTYRPKWGIITHQADDDTNEELAAIINGAQPDILIIDIQMGRANGWKVISLLSRAVLPLIVVSSGTPDDPPKEIADRVFALLPKPFKPADMRAMLDRLEKTVAEKTV